MLDKQEKRIRRHKRVRAKVKGTAICPRFSVFKSNKHITLQLIDDITNKSLLQISDIKKGAKKKGTKTESAFELGKIFAEKAREQKIEKVVFDRGGFKYIGRIKAVAEGAREGGLKF